MSKSQSKREILNWIGRTPLGVNTLRLTCPQCGGPHWTKCEDGWACAACGEFVYPESMGVEVADARAGITASKEDKPTVDNGASKSISSDRAKCLRAL